MTEQYAYLPNFRFMLRVNGIDLPLKSVSAFQRENEYDYIQEGGMNDYVYLRRKPISKPYTLRVERYIPTDFDDPLSNGSELFLPLLLFVGRNSGGKMGFGRYYVFTGAVVMGKEYGGLDSERAGLLTETITIGYNQMFCITNADDDEDDKSPWQIADGDGDDAALNVSRKYSKTPKEPLQNKMNKRAFKASAEKWEFDGLKKGGKGTISHTPLNEDGEMDKADMIDKRRHFSFAGTFNPLASAEMKSTRSAVNASRESYGIEELSKDEMTEKAKMFELTPDGSVGGNGVIFAPKNIDNNKKAKADFIKNEKKWGFKPDDKKSKEGIGVQSAQNGLVTKHVENPDGSSTGLGRPELTIKEMEAKARKFELTENKNVMGNGTVSARRNPEDKELHQKQLEEASQKWEFSDKDKAGKGESRRDYKGIKEDTKKEHVDKAKKFEMTDKDTVGGNGVLLSPHDIDQNKENKDDFKSKGKRWKFNGKKKAGQGDNSSQNQHMVLNEDTVTSIGPNEASKGKLEQLSKKWRFKDDTKAGEGVSSSQNNKAVLNDNSKNANIGAKEESRKTLEGKAKKWKLNNTTKAGNGVSSSQNSKVKLNEGTIANIGPNEVSKESLIGKANKWEFNDTNKAGSGESSRNTGNIKELSKDEMAKKAQRGMTTNKAIADFLMK